MNPITIAYITARKEPKFDWFFDSLARECAGDARGITVLVVDFYADAHKPEDGWNSADAIERLGGIVAASCGLHGASVRHVAPIWDTWQGPHRLTRDNWFAKPNYLNAAVVHCQTSHLCCVDDLSVIMPGWLRSVREASTWNGVTCGRYEKRRKMVVENGVVVSSETFSGGADRRNSAGSPGEVIHCHPEWMYGCSFVAPVEALLKVNGWPAITNGMGYEDCATGIVIARHSYQFRYDRRMLTIESDEHHFIGQQMLRDDPCKGDPNAKPRDDKSHALKRMAEDMERMRWNNFFGPDGLSGLKARVMAGEPMPVFAEPITEWFSGRPLSELHLSPAQLVPHE